MTEEILSLSTLVQRATINIASKKHRAGKVYELRNVADLGPYEYAVILNGTGEYDRLKALKKLTPAQERQVKKLLNDLVKLICPDVEPIVLSALTDEQKSMVVVTWSAHIQSQVAAEGNAPRSRRTTSASSRGSKRSTAATRKPGSTPRRGR